MKILFVSMVVLAISMSVTAVEDKEYQHILHSLESGEYSKTIKKLEVYHSKGKKHEQSMFLLAHLYSVENKLNESVNTYFKTEPEHRDLKFWTALLPVYIKLIKSDPKSKSLSKERSETILNEMMKVVPQYDKMTKDLMETLLSHLEDNQLKKTFCQDLKIKNSKKCSLL